MNGKIFPLPIFLLLLNCAAQPDSLISQSTSPPLSPAGINWGYPYRNREKPALFDELNLNWFRIDFYWHKMEPQEGKWHFADHDRFFANMDEEKDHFVGVLGFDTPWIHENGEREKQIAPEDFDRFLKYVETVVRRYGDRVDEWEIWNEPNLPFNGFWSGSDRDFINLTLAVAERIRAVDPEATILVGSLWRYDSAYLNKLDRAGVLAAGDHLSFHPYYDKPVKIFEKTKDLLSDLENRQFPGELRITEAGFNTYGVTPTSCPPEEQGRMVMETLAGLGELGFPYLIWYNLYNREDEGKGIWTDMYGILLLKGDGRLEYKTGGWALRRYNELIAGKYPSPVQNTIQGDNLIARFYSSEAEDKPNTLLLMTGKGEEILKFEGPDSLLLYNGADGSIEKINSQGIRKIEYETPIILTSPRIGEWEISIIP
ncbi:MAG: cellulase family glycosylhydrolase [Spirochaetales bacterium]|nr:cellulase family glycosylhydrolase [Spirochaetales bacterium]